MSVVQTTCAEIALVGLRSPGNKARAICVVSPPEFEPSSSDQITLSLVDGVPLVRTTPRFG